MTLGQVYVQGRGRSAGRSTAKSLSTASPAPFVSPLRRAAWSTCALLLLGAAPAHAAGGGNPWEGAVFVAAGPLVMLLCLASMAVVYLIAASFRKQERLVALAQSASTHVGRGRFVFTLWGILAEVMLLTAGILLAKIPPAGLLVALVWLLALALAGLGVVVSAAMAGRRLHTELAGGEITPLGSLGIGLRLYFVAAALPFLGWIVILLLAANGVGAVLTAASRGGGDADGMSLE